MHTQSPSRPFAPPVPAPAVAPSDPSRLTDRFGRRHTSIRVSVTDRCNLRCSYCKPAGAVSYAERAETLSDDEIVALVRALAARGLRKVRLTGGEPLLRRDLPALAARLAALPGIDFVGITSNGVLLAQHLDALLAGGVRGVNLSLDTFDRERFRALCGVDAVDDVRAALDGLLARPFAQRKLNAVIQRGVNDDEILRFAQLARDHAIDVRLLEFLPFAGNGWTPERWMPAADMIDRIERAHGVTFAPLPEDGGVARLYEAPGFRGRLGFITGISHKFCDGCTRLRLTARGELRPCLYLDRGVPLHDLARAGTLDAALDERVRAALDMKPWENGLHPDHAPEGIPVMTTLGG